MVNRIDLAGQRFGRLVITHEVERIAKYVRRWAYKCDCGNESISTQPDLISGRVNSCGCFRVEQLIQRSATHGHGGRKTRTSEYRSWAMMIARCTNSNMAQWKDYGGRGITVCERWRNSFELFLLDMGKKPTPKHSIDRYPNNDGNYEPSNCRWGTKEQQSRGTRRNIWFTYDGKTMILKDWAVELKTTVSNIQYQTKIKKKSFGILAAGLDLQLQLNQINKKYAA